MARLAHLMMLGALLLAMLCRAHAQNPQSPDQNGKQGEQQASQPSGENSAEQPPQLDPDVDPRCDFGPPQPALVGADYADYHVARNRGDESKPPQQLTETATLADGTRLAVVSNSCVDSFGHEFRFTYAHAAHAAEDTAFWAAAASSAVVELHLSTGAGGELTELRAFLERAPKLPRHGSRVEQCHDLTQPQTGGCSWESHGSYVLTIEHKGGATKVVVSVDHSG